MCPYEHQEENLGGPISPATKEETSHLQEADGNRLEQVSAHCDPRYRVSTVMQVLDVLCHNDLLRAMGCADEKEKVAVTWWQRQTAHFFNFGTHRLAKGG